jgi:hypothetical protein
LADLPRKNLGQRLNVPERNNFYNHTYNGIGVVYLRLRVFAAGKKTYQEDLSQRPNGGAWSLKMKAIINLTQHPATKEQLAAGVVDVCNEEALRGLLTFNECPTHQEVVDRAVQIVKLATESSETQGMAFMYAMIGGAPYLMRPLETALLCAGITPVYAFSKRVSEEKVMPDGSVQKVNVFKHIGFVTGE